MKYLETIYQRYRKASKESKGKILDELCNVCKYNRKYAIWKIRQLPKEDKPKVPLKKRRPKKYDYRVLEVIEGVWNTANYPWSLRLKEIVRLWLPWIRSRYRITPEIEEKLLSISQSTIEKEKNLRRQF